MTTIIQHTKYVDFLLQPRFFLNLLLELLFDLHLLNSFKNRWFYFILNQPNLLTLTQSE